MLVLDEVLSTQDTARELIASGDKVPAAILAHDQTQGRGRFARKWESKRGDSLTASILFNEQADHPTPYLLGMFVALHAAQIIGCNLQWPNDLIWQGRKLGGILAEVFPDSQGRCVTVVGIGVNLSHVEVSKAIEREIAGAWECGYTDPNAENLLAHILNGLANTPIPYSWGEMEDAWMKFDQTAGKRYILPSNEEVIARGIGKSGHLETTDGGQVFAADAWFGVRLNNVG